MSYEERVAEFLAAEKVALNPIRWRTRNHPNHTEALIRLKTEGIVKPRGYVILASHMYLIPRKYKFALFFGTARILALDVEPRLAHRLSLKKISINCTHWHEYGRDEELESRVLSHREWLDEFWKRARIAYGRPYVPPIHDRVQLRLWR